MTNYRVETYNRLEEIRNELEATARDFARNESVAQAGQPPSPVNGYLQRAIDAAVSARDEIHSLRVDSNISTG